jgi:Ca-activated chloride channel family protein
MIRLANPEYLLFMVLFVLLIWIYIRRERGKKPAIQYSDISLVTGIKASPFLRFRHLPFILWLLGLGVLIIALARPQRGSTEQEIITHGVDIMLVQDISTSMKALDFTPKNRLYVAKETIKKFIGKRNNDLIGLVVFAGRSYTKCPLTIDYGVLLQFLDDVKFDEIEDGTAIGTALATAAYRLKDSQAKSKIIILITDGANNRGEISPITAAQAAAKLGIKIYTIGVGREGEVPYPFEIQDPWSGQVQTRVQMIKSDLDEQTLVNIANASKGAFFRARDPKKLEEIYNEIDKLEKSEIKTKTYTTYEERFSPWLIAGFLLVCLELILRNTRFRRIP